MPRFIDLYLSVIVEYQTESSKDLLSAYLCFCNSSTGKFFYMELFMCIIPTKVFAKYYV